MINAGQGRNRTTDTPIRLHAWGDAQDLVSIPATIFGAAITTRDLEFAACGGSHLRLLDDEERYLYPI